MVKIKTKKKLKFPELIDHIVDTGYKNVNYFSSDNRTIVEVSSTQGIRINKTVFPHETFEVEVEEEITMGTVLDNVVIVRRQISPFVIENIKVCRKGNVSINQILSQQIDNTQSVYLEIHLMVNDSINQLIWTREKGLVD